jgi:hypothetical protein
MDATDVDEIREALISSEKVDAGRIDVSVDGTTVVLRGSVPEPEQGDLAEMLAGNLASDVRNELRVDAALREGAVDPQPVEEAIPAEGEILVGSTDMLAGPDEGGMVADTSRAFEENEPWDPPEEPQLAGTPAEVRGETGFGAGATVDEEEAAATGDETPAAPDLTLKDLQASAAGAAPPSLDETATAPRDQAQPDPVGLDPLGHTPPEGAGDFPAPVPGASSGIGGVGEGTAGGGSISGVPATETGSLGADTRGADPVRSTGGSMTDAGTERGPQSREDAALREDFPDPD